ncbi:MAG: hypothetical protein AAGJ34_07990 [Pseudomonadota bacterium]
MSNKISNAHDLTGTGQYAEGYYSDLVEYEALEPIERFSNFTIGSTSPAGFSLTASAKTSVNILGTKVTPTVQTYVSEPVPGGTGLAVNTYGTMSTSSMSLKVPNTNLSISFTVTETSVFVSNRTLGLKGEIPNAELVSTLTTALERVVGIELAQYYANGFANGVFEIQGIQSDFSDLVEELVENQLPNTLNFQAGGLENATQPPREFVGLVEGRLFTKSTKTDDIFSTDLSTGYSYNVTKFNAELSEYPNPSGTWKEKAPGGWEWKYHPEHPNANLAGKDWTRGGDYNGDGYQNELDVHEYDADLYGRHADIAELEGNDWKAKRNRELEATALEKLE